MSERHYTSEREELAKAYPGYNWKKKVLGMSDAQVHAAIVDIRKRREKQAKKSVS